MTDKMHTPQYRCPTCDKKDTKEKIYYHHRKEHGEGLPSKANAVYWDKLRINK